MKRHESTRTGRSAGISDLHTCLKLLTTALFRELPVTENRFGLGTELAALMLAGHPLL